MSTSDGSGQSDPSKKKRKHVDDEQGENVRWPDDKDNKLKELLLEQIQKGRKVEKSYSKAAWVEVTKKFFEVFGDLRYNEEKMRNRIRTWKNRYNIMYDIVKQSGFGWEPLTRRLDVPEDVWTDYLKNHPTAKNYRRMKLTDFYELAQLLGEDTASGEWARGGYETLEEVRANEVEEDIQLDVEDLEIPSNAHSESTSRLSTTPSSSRTAQKASQSKKKGVSLADAITNMTEMMSHSFEKKKSSMEPVAWMAPLIALNLEEPTLLAAITLLNKEPHSGNTFMSIPFDDLRKKWLLQTLEESRKLGLS